MDRNRTLNRMAFCETAPGDRFSFFAICVPESLAFAKALKVLTSSFDHANARFFAFAMMTPMWKGLAS